MSERITYFDSFRGIAILIIVAGHCYNGWAVHHVWELMITNAITGGTALFVFISGFFFHAVFARRFDYGRFLKKKFHSVLVPYLVLSIIYIAFYFSAKGYVPFPDTLGIENQLLRLLIDLATGRHLEAYWYIPFIFCVFALSPLILPFLHLALWQQRILIVTWLVLASFIHRPTLGLNPLHSALYFMPFYLMGALFSMRRAILEPRLKAALPLSFLGWIGVLVIMARLGLAGNATAPVPWQAIGFDWMVPQKFLLILVILGCLLHVQHRSQPILSYLAMISFPIFFIHPWILALSSFTGLRDALPEGAAGFVTLTLLVLGLSCLIAELYRRIMARLRALPGAA